MEYSNFKSMMQSGTIGLPAMIPHCLVGGADSRIVFQASFMLLDLFLLSRFLSQMCMTWLIKTIYFSSFVYEHHVNLLQAECEFNH